MIFEWLYICKVKGCSRAATHGPYCLQHKTRRYEKK